MKRMNHDNKKDNLKKFFIKLLAITVSIIVVINVTYNLIFAENFAIVNKLLSVGEKENIEQIKDKVRNEIKKGLAKDKILNDEDKILLRKFYLKIKNEFKEIE